MNAIKEALENAISLEQYDLMVALYNLVHYLFPGCPAIPDSTSTEQERRAWMTSVYNMVAESDQ